MLAMVEQRAGVEAQEKCMAINEGLAEANRDGGLWAMSWLPFGFPIDSSARFEDSAQSCMRR